MRERSEQALRIACLILAGLLVFQVGFRVLRRDPLAKISIPLLPALTNAPDAQSKVTNEPTQLARKTGTNTLAASSGVKATNAAAVFPAINGGTNVAHSKPGTANTNNAIPELVKSVGPITNESRTSTHAVRPTPGTNLLAGVQAGNRMILRSNAVSNLPESNLVAAASLAGTNPAARSAVVHKGTTTARGDIPMPGMGQPGRPGTGNAPKALPPAVQARVDRIIESELLGPVMRPLPMALLGIAGDVAFLRGPSGQTGLVKAGDKLGELKLIEIGVNRVLVEEDGQKTELMMFSGYGSESLLPKTKDNSQ